MKNEEMTISSYIHTEESLNEVEEMWHALVKALPDNVTVLDRTGKILLTNRVVPGLSISQVEGKHLFDYIPVDQHEALKQAMRNVIETRETDGYEAAILSENGTKTWWSNRIAAIKRNGNVEKFLIIGHEITERKQIEEERELLIKELQNALAKVKTLSGFIPICASCKKIRDDKGYWNQIEAYISEHSEAEFSHSLCPECLQKLYPEFHKSREGALSE